MKDSLIQELHRATKIMGQQMSGSIREVQAGLRQQRGSEADLRRQAAQSRRQAKKNHDAQKKRRAGSRTSTTELKRLAKAKLRLADAQRPTGKGAVVSREQRLRAAEASVCRDKRNARKRRIRARGDLADRLSRLARAEADLIKDWRPSRQAIEHRLRALAVRFAQ